MLRGEHADTACFYAYSSYSAAGGLLHGGNINTIGYPHPNANAHTNRDAHRADSHRYANGSDTHTNGNLELSEPRFFSGTARAGILLRRNRR
jgi:hypothetical protein